MTTFTGAQSTHQNTPAAHTTQRVIAALSRRPWLLAAGVLMIALLSSYVHVLHGQVERGERFRQALAQSGTHSARSNTQRLADVSMQSLSLTQVSLDTTH